MEKKFQNEKFYLASISLCTLTYSTTNIGKNPKIKSKDHIFFPSLHTMQYRSTVSSKILTTSKFSKFESFHSKSLNPSSPFIPTQIPDPSMKAIEFHLLFEFQADHYSYKSNPTKSAWFLFKKARVRNYQPKREEGLNWERREGPA